MRIRDTSILEFISSSENRTFTFKIPDYQRNYSWTKSQAKVFIEDLDRLIKNPKNQFLGNIISERDFLNQTITMIDGQQRLTTILLMIIAIYHLAQQNSKLSSKSADEIQKYLVLHNSRETDSPKLKLKPNTQDEEAFNQIYHHNKKVLDESYKATNLYKTYIELYDSMEQSSRDLSVYIDKLDSMRIAWIELDNDADDSPLRIFESINSKGIALTAGDKIRNHSLLVASDELREYIYKRYWSKLENELINTVEQKDDIDDFFKNFLIIQYSGQNIGNKQLYEKFKSFLKENNKDVDLISKEQINSYYEPIMENFKRYSFIKYGNYEKSNYQIFSNQSHRIRFLKITAVTPFLMTILEKYDAKECRPQHVKLILETLEILIVRRYLCGQLQSNVLQAGLFPLHNKIQEKLGNKTYSFDEYLKYYKQYILPLIPTDDEIKRRAPYRDHGSIKKNILRLVLSSCDDKKSNDSSALRNENLTIEHIMPKNLSDDWKTDLGTEHESVHSNYLSKLANLTLTAYNRKLSNRTFKEKLTMEHGFKASPLHINQEIAKYDTWNKKTLNQRTEWWINQINELWSIKQIEQGVK